MKYEYKREWWFSGPPNNNSLCEPMEEIIEKAQTEGWEFLSVIPGFDHPIAEHVTPPQLLFRRPRDDSTEGAGAMSGDQPYKHQSMKSGVAIVGMYSVMGRAPYG